MEFTNTFTIPVGIDDAFAVLTDLEKVAPCMPGAKLESVENGTYTGRVKVKVGPMSLTYRGKAKVVDPDPDAHTARIEARGNEQRGGGTANADVSAEMTEVEDGTEVVVTSSIDVTGRPAQFGRGVMADVGAKIIDTFAECLSRRLSEGGGQHAADAAADGDAGAGDDAAGDGAGVDDGDEAAGAVGDESAATSAVAGAAADAVAAAGSATAAASDGARRLLSSEPEVEALDLMDVAGDATIKRAAPIVLGVLTLGLVWWLVRRRKRD